MKRLKIPAIVLAIGIVVAVVAGLLTCITKAPTITEHDFDYSVTYKLDGKTETIDGVYKIKFDYTGVGIDPKERYYKGQHLVDSDHPGAYTIAQKDDLELRIVFIFTDAFLMGDGDRGDEYSDVIPDPYLAVFEANECESYDPEMLEKFDAELISWELPQPIENSFAFAGFSLLHSESMLVMLLAALLTIVACIIFVKRDKAVPYKALDKISIVLNCVVGAVALPFATIVVALMGLVYSGDEITYLVFLCVPAITAFSIAASLALRRKGFTKSGFFAQFIGVVLFVLLILVEAVCG